MSSLLAHLAYARIDRPRLLLTYLVGLGAGVVLAALLLAAIGAWSIP
jgi:hypothetical protein